MYVCLCKGITDRQIQDEICKGACTMRELYKRLGIASTCGKCGEQTRQLLIQSLSQNPPSSR